MTTIYEGNRQLLVEARAVISGYTSNPLELEREVDKYARSIDHKAWVLEGNNGTLGFIQSKLSEDKLSGDTSDLTYHRQLGHIVRLAVRQDQWGKRLGEFLIAAAEEWLKEYKPGAWLDYYECNERARRLYARCGYKPVAQFTECGWKQRVIAVKTW